jgi:hypothetical protein
MSSKFDDYQLTKQTKYFFSFSNSDGETGATPSNFNVMMNNPSFTNIQSYGQQTSVKFTPLSVVMDLKFFNVSSALLNNKIIVASTMFANTPVSIIIPDGYYTAVSLASALQALLEANVRFVGVPPTSATWLVDVQNAVNIRIRFTGTFATPAITKITFRDQGPQTFDSRSTLGFSSDSYDITYASRATGITGELAVDLIPYDNLRICSNVAKRFWIKRNGVLVQSDVLLEIPIIDYSLGSTVKWEATDELYSQDVFSDFGNVSFSIKDKNGDIIPFDSTAKINIVFSIERTIRYPSPEEKLRAIQNYASYSG